MMRTDNDIYIDMGSILEAIAPSGSVRVIMRAELDPASDVGSFDFDSVAEDGSVNWFVPDAKPNAILMNLVVELRKWFVANELTSGRPPWSACEVSFDVRTQRISLGFSYE